jgi:hypothetical protein
MNRISSCLPSSTPSPIHTAASPLKASWTISRGSRVIQHGSASETIWRVPGQPFLAFGDFQAEAWQWYRLDVDASSDETRLAQANTRLTVGIWTEKPFLYGPGVHGCQAGDKDHLRVMPFHRRPSDFVVPSCAAGSTLGPISASSSPLKLRSAKIYAKAFFRNLRVRSQANLALPGS